MNAACPICGQTKKPLKKKLYDYDICKKCWSKFANRRQLAFFVDVMLYRIAVFGVTLVILVGLESAGPMPPAALNGIDAIVTLGGIALFVSKDIFHGQSLGKMLTGVRVIDRVTGEPTGWSQSIKRTLPTLIPIVPLVMAVQLGKGPRWGDKWARSKVIWLKYAESPVFASEATAREAAPEFGAPYVPQGVVPESDNPYRSPVG